MPPCEQHESKFLRGQSREQLHDHSWDNHIRGQSNGHIDVLRRGHVLEHECHNEDRDGQVHGRLAHGVLVHGGTVRGRLVRGVLVHDELECQNNGTGSNCSSAVQGRFQREQDQLSVQTHSNANSPTVPLSPLVHDSRLIH